MKATAKRMLALVLAMLTIMGNFALPANAASSLEEAMNEVHVYATVKDLKWLTMNGNVQTLWYTYYYYNPLNNTSGKEIPAYCVDPRLYGVPWKIKQDTSIEHISYRAESAVSDPKVCGIISNGYPHMTLEDYGLQDRYEAYYATKMALWCYLLGNWSISGMGVNPNLTGADKQAAQRVLSAAKDIYARGMEWTSIVSPKLTATPDQATAYAATVNGEEVYQQVFTIESETWAITPVLLSLGNYSVGL